jgi:hypothetical protein
MVQVSFVSSVAARMGSDEFFDPLMLMRPLSGAPPCTMSFSMLQALCCGMAQWQALLRFPRQRMAV